MANVKSNIISAKDAVLTQVDRGLQNVERVAVVTLNTGGALADNSTLLLAEIPVDARITSFRLWSDDLGTTGTLNAGFYPGNVDTDNVTAADAVDEDAIASAIDVNAAAVSDSEIRFEANDINTIGQPAWELAGLSARPAYGTFLIAFTLAQATTAAGDVSAVIRYTE